MKALYKSEHVEAVVVGSVGLITLQRPKALNALTLDMVRALDSHLRAWQADEGVFAVVIRGSDKNGPFGHFCAGGDIRFFHDAALSGDAALDAFFTEEYALNYLIHTYQKPYIALMDGVVMGGGMGISQGASLRVVTPHSKLAMPETNIGLFPDVGGGFFLSRLPGHTGEWLALTGHVIGAADAIALGLADCCIERSSLPVLWEELRETPFQTPEAVQRWVAVKASPTPESHILTHGPWIDAVFSAPSVREIMARLSEMSQSVDPAEAEWASSVHTQLSARSPLMLHVVLEQVRRARQLSLADDLAMERVMVHQCFYLRPGAASETVEGVRALAVDKDHQPKWNPARIEDVTPEMVAAFFESPWTPEVHPMVGLLGT